jgi:hypothetical protein
MISAKVLICSSESLIIWWFIATLAYKNQDFCWHSCVSRCAKQKKKKNKKEKKQQLELDQDFYIH